MMEKVKVSKEVKEVLDLNMFRGSEIILKIHAVGWRLPATKILNMYTMLEMAEILIKGYEVEKTPAELLKHFETEINTLSVIPQNKDYCKGARETIQFFKENFEIKGINDK